MKNMQMQTKPKERLNISVPMTLAEREEFKDFIERKGLNMGGFLRNVILRLMQEEEANGLSRLSRS